jgi:DNA adenine methylase
MLKFLVAGLVCFLLAKKPSPVEVYNDLNSGLINFFRVLRDPVKFEFFRELVSLTPHSREEYYHCWNTWEDCKNDIERAYKWYVITRMGFGGHFGSGWGFDVTSSSRGMAEICSNRLSAIEMLPEIHRRIMRVQIEHRDFRFCIKPYDTQDTFFYLDPPYVPDTRRGGKYKHEMTIRDHEDLIDMLLSIKGKAMLSGYRHEVHEPLEKAGWRRLDFETACFAVGKTRATGILGKGSAMKMQPRIESVWLSPNNNAEEVRQRQMFLFDEPFTVKALGD